MSARPFDKLIRRYTGVSIRGGRQRLGRASVRCVPGVAALEERALLSTITVTNDHDSGSGSLRAALASAVAGDKIDFASSAYGTIKLSSGALDVATSVSIDGPGANKVTINGNNTFQDLMVNASVTARVSGLTFTGGDAPATYPYGGGGIFNAGTLTVDNCVVSNNTGGIGAGISNNGVLTVSNSVISNNYAGGFGIGGGISNNADATLTVTGSSITNNSMSPTGFGGGGIANVGTLTIIGSVISNNTGNNGGGIYSGDVFGQGDVTITGSVVSNNTGAGGGGLSLYGSTATISLSTFSNNTAGNSSEEFGIGGGIEATAPVALNISWSLFVDNSAVGTQSYGNALGGGIWVFGPYYPSPASNLNVSNSSFVGNTAQAWSSYGGAIDAEVQTNVTVTGSSFSGNTATGDYAATGGAIRIENYTGQPTASISGSTFLNNGAIVPSTSTIYGGNANGGALYSTGTPITISGSSFIADEAVGGPNGGFGVGGAVEDQSNSPLTLSNSLLMNNSAIAGSGSAEGYSGWGVGGGLVVFGSSAAVSNTDFWDNQAIGGAASQAGNVGGNGWGGAIQNEFSTVTLTGCDIQSNQAIGGAGTDGATGGDGQGGGIENEGTLTITNGQISGNQAIGGAGGGDGEGGGIYTDGTTTLIGVLVTSNQADGGSDGGQGIGGGLFINSGTTTLEGNTKVSGNSASTSSNNIYGTYST